MDRGSPRIQVTYLEFSFGLDNGKLGTDYDTCKVLLNGVFVVEPIHNIYLWSYGHSVHAFIGHVLRLLGKEKSADIHRMDHCLQMKSLHCSGCSFVSEIMKYKYPNMLCFSQQTYPHVLYSVSNLSTLFFNLSSILMTEMKKKVIYKHMLYFSTNNFWLPVSGTLLGIGDIIVSKTVRK